MHHPDRSPRRLPLPVLALLGAAALATILAGCSNVAPGAHLAFVTALDCTRTIDLSQTGGSYAQPYTFTLQPVLVNLTAGEQGRVMGAASFTSPHRGPCPRPPHGCRPSA